MRLRRFAAPLAGAGIVLGAVLGLTGCDDGCPTGEHSQIAGYTQVWIPGTTVGKVTTPGHFQSTPNYVCVEDR